MLILGIIFFILAASGGSIYLRYRGVRLAYIWLLLVAIVSLVWVILIIIQPEKIPPFTINNWVKIGASPVNLIYQVNSTNWPISISYFSILLAFFLTSIAQLDGNKSLYGWVEMAVLIILGWLCLLAGDYWSILIGWTMIDFVELVFHFRYKGINSNNFFLHFSSKFVGSLLLIFAISRSYQINPVSLFEKKIEGIGLILSLAAVLHSGIIFKILEKPSGEIFPNKSIVFLRIISFISSFFLLSFAPVPDLKILTTLLLKIILFSFAANMIYKWAAVRDEIPGIRSVLPGFAALILLMYFSGIGEFIAVWLIVLLAPLGWLYLYTEREPKLLFLLFLNLFFISGFPYSITFSGFSQLLLQEKWMDMFFISVVMAVLIAGCVHHGSKQNGNFKNLEPWYQFIYLIGLFLPIISMSAVVLRSSRISLNGWWIGFLVAFFSICLYLFQLNHKKGPRLFSNTLSSNTELVVKSTSGIKVIFNGVLVILEKSMLFISTLFEGSGGILWSVVFLILFMAILKFQGDY